MSGQNDSWDLGSDLGLRVQGLGGDDRPKAPGALWACPLLRLPADGILHVSSVSARDSILKLQFAWGSQVGCFPSSGLQMAFYIYVFYLSKMYEFVDTVRAPSYPYPPKP